MGATLTTEGDIKVVRVEGILRKAELDAIQWGSVSELAEDAHVKILVLAEAFEGWHRGDQWGDVDFISTHGDRIEKIALVGKPKWEDQLLMFTGSGFRSTQIEFFSPNQLDQARRWLAGTE